jgi:nucleotide sugar dehydrogenase
MEMLKKEGFKVANNVKDALKQTDITFVCVNTPTGPNDEQDLSQVKSALFSVTEALNESNRYNLIVFRSTMLPGTMDEIVIDYIDKECKKVRGRDYNVCYNPEFLRQESAYEDFFIPDRVIIGEDIEASSKLLQDLYKPLTEKIIVTSFKAAEMIKYTANCFLSLKISFFNEIGMVCKELGIDDKAVSLGVSLDKRIGKYGTIAGRPFEGACLPKDTKALSTFIRKRGWTPDLLKVTLDINKKIEELVTKTALTK